MDDPSFWRFWRRPPGAVPVPLTTREVEYLIPRSPSSVVVLKEVCGTVAGQQVASEGLTITCISSRAVALLDWYPRQPEGAEACSYATPGAWLPTRCLPCHQVASTFLHLSVQVYQDHRDPTRFAWGGSAVARVACGFANTSMSGVLLFGVKRRTRELTGVPAEHVEDLVAAITQALKTMAQPPIKHACGRHQVTASCSRSACTGLYRVTPFLVTHQSHVVPCMGSCAWVDAT
jgi:hypothetical protein